MSGPILTIKLHIPTPKMSVVLRPRLFDQMDEGLQRKLTLVSAPAGFGKTTLVSEWVSRCNQRVAWLSLDEADNGQSRFLIYLVAALQTLEKNIGEGLLPALQSQQPLTIERVVTALVNEVTWFLEDFILVLDDYHVLDTSVAAHALAFLLDHMPPQMHLVVATREDPQLRLARLRAQDQLTEVRAADLRFTPVEAAVFLNDVMGLNLQAEDVAALENRTEGWIAGLQLAALSMRKREDIHSFVQAFAGDHRYIVDYLVEEVLQRQPDPVRNFLLQTSILDRFSGALCDAVTGNQQSSVMLENLERSNLFIVPQDDTRQWFRYHRLFADVLRAHVDAEQPEQVPILHRRASEWYASSGLCADAVHHALAAKDFELAAAFVERAWPAMDRSFEVATWLGWARALPDQLIRAMPVLSVDYAWALLEQGELESADSHLRNAEAWLTRFSDVGEQSADAETEMIVVDDAQFRTLPATLAAARAYHAQAHGEVSETVKYGQQALDLLPEDDHLQRGIAAALLGVAYWTNGELDAAHSTLAEGMAHMRTTGNFLFGIRGTYILADIRMAQGRLREAIQTYEQSLQSAAEQGEDVLRGTADLYLRLSELYREQNNLTAAAQHLRKSEALGEQAASPHWRYRRYLALARIKEIHGDFDGALEQLGKAERHYVRTPVPDVRPIAAIRARIWVAQHRLTEAQTWVRTHSLSVDDDLSYANEFEHVTLARVLIAAYRQDRKTGLIHEAIRLLERLLIAAEAAGRMGSAIKIRVLQALAYEAQEDISRALIPLERALKLAQPEGYIRMFADEGAPMARLLSEAAPRGMMPDYVALLRAVFDSSIHQNSDTSSDLALVEPLSQRELDVLRLIADGCSNQEIAEQLFLALSTIKGHNRSIFDKLHVQRRTEAVARARELNLL